MIRLQSYHARLSPVALRQTALVLVLIVLDILFGGGHVPIRADLLLSGLACLFLLALVARRLELGLAAVLLSFLVDITIYSTGSLNLSVTFLLVVALIGLWAFRQIQERRLRFDAPGLTPLVVWMVVSIISVLYSYIAWDARVPGQGQSWVEGHRWIGYQLSALAGPIFTTGVYVLAVNGIRSRRWLAILWAVAIAVLAYLVARSQLGFLQRPLIVPWQVDLSDVDRSITSGVPEMYLAILALGLLLFERDSLKRVAYALLFGMGVSGVLAAYYLNTWIGLLGGCLIVIWQRSRRLFAAAVVGLGVAGVVLLPIINEIINHRVSSGGDLLRLTVWSSTLAIWETSPLLGVGPGNLPSYMLAFSPLPWDWVRQGLFDSHNTYLRVLVETGAVGLICVLCFIVSYLKQLWGWTWNSKDELVSAISTGGIGVFVANMVTATVAGGLFATSSGALFSVSGYAFNWMLFGAAIAARRLSETPSQSEAL